MSLGGCLEAGGGRISGAEDDSMQVTLAEGESAYGQSTGFR